MADNKKIKLYNYKANVMNVFHMFKYTVEFILCQFEKALNYNLSRKISQLILICLYLKCQNLFALIIFLSGFEEAIKTITSVLHFFDDPNEVIF